MPQGSTCFISTTYRNKYKQVDSNSFSSVTPRQCHNAGVKAQHHGTSALAGSGTAGTPRLNNENGRKNQRRDNPAVAGCVSELRKKRDLVPRETGKAERLHRQAGAAKHSGQPHLLSPQARQVRQPSICTAALVWHLPHSWAPAGYSSVLSSHSASAWLWAARPVNSARFCSR